MLSREVLRRVRHLQVRARRAVLDLLGGKYHSIFRGLGIAFDEVRAYQPGDDLRTIDWNVTARMGHPYVKRFIEERELKVVLMIDVSSSGRCGAGLLTKQEVVAELASLLAFSAISNNDKVGLLTFTDRVERYVPPRKGSQHVLRLMRDLLFVRPERAKTSLAAALDYLNRVLRRRAIVFLLSDFLDHGYEKALQRTARRHDLIAIRVYDRREEELPSVGLVECEDIETGERRLIDTMSAEVRKAYAEQARVRRERLQQTIKAGRADLVETSTDGGHLDNLVEFFQRRERRR